MDVTASFLTGSLLTLLVPVSLLTAVCIWWAFILRRRSREG
ncbi:MAG: hypothetical protein ACYDCH_11620 [Gaiellaceae bacterium]